MDGIWLWDKAASIWRKALCDADGKLIISDEDPFEVIQDTPEDLKHTPHGYYAIGGTYLPLAVDVAGKLQIDIASLAHLDDIGDVTIAAVADGEFLSWSDGLGYWQNRALAEGDIPAEIARDAEVTAAINALAAIALPAAIVFIIDGGGAEISLLEKGHLEIPFACTINRVTLLADQSGSIVIDIWKDTYALFPPTVADTITAAAKPTITAAQKSQDTTLVGWTTAIAAGDILAFNVDSVTDIERVTLVLKVTKT